MVELCRVVRAAAVFAFVLCPAALASILTFTDRDAWTSAVPLPIHTEDFEAEPAGFEDLVFPYVTASGITLNASGSGVVAQMLPSNTATGTVGPHFRAFSGDQMIFGFLFAVFAFGFDYATPDEGWTVRMESFSAPLSASAGIPSFFGVVLTPPTAGVTEFRFEDPSFIQGGISVDNLSYAVPEPSTSLLVGGAFLLALAAVRRQRLGKRNGAWLERHRRCRPRWLRIVQPERRGKRVG
jgi:hypothetical protein